MSTRALASHRASRWSRVFRLLREFVLREHLTRYRQSTLSITWSLITPIAVMAVYGVVLRGAFNVDGDGVPYLTFAWTGMVAWTFFSLSIGSAMPSLVESADLMSKIYFPREVLPLALVGIAGLDLSIGLASAVALAAWEGLLSVTAPAALVAIVLLVVWTAALAVLGSAVTVFARDFNHFVQLLLRVGFFATPVMYPPALIPAGWRWVAVVNPVAVAIEALRDTLLRGRWPDWPLVGGQMVVGAGLFFAAVAYVRAVEDRMVDVV